MNVQTTIHFNEGLLTKMNKHLMPEFGTSTYRCRMECVADLVRVLARYFDCNQGVCVNGERVSEAFINLLRVEGLEIWFESNLTFSALQAFIDSNEDCHVMSQTLHFAECYTGEDRGAASTHRTPTVTTDAR